MFLLKSKGLLGKLVKNIVTDDTADNKEAVLQRNDLKYLRYRGKIIRNIELHHLPFGTPITDTSKRFTNTLIKLANLVHRDTRPYVIQNNLFFKKGDKVFPYLLADNERFLRDLEYIGDARIMIRRIPGINDSVDIVVVTKDVLSIGGSFQMSSTSRYKLAIREANLGGWGDKIEGRMLYDSRRNNKIGAGIEYVRRNIMGSFIDGYFGWQSITPTIIGGWEQERTLYARFNKPLIHPYMKWTYALEVAQHKTVNQYQPDSIFKKDYNYSYYNVDAWGAFTTQAGQSSRTRADDRLRTLIGLRVVKQQFQELPERYDNSYFFRYYDITAVLGSLSLFRQDFYKTRYIYGFGRTEDVPEGIDASITTGWTRKQQRTR
ncbi:MAG TPA: hypothetical protein VLC28_14010, partial [Flavitalea sp.]|nr:hypothetical protein [Flavitalea sp.]